MVRSKFFIPQLISKFAPKYENMKHQKFLYLLLLINISNIAFSKSPTKFKKAKVYFTNGEMKKGKVKIPYGKISTFKFIEEGTKKKRKLDARDIEKVDIWGTIYRFIKVRGTKKPILLLEQIPQQKVGLYYYEYKRMSTGPNDLGSTDKKYSYLKMDVDREAFSVRSVIRKGKKKGLSIYLSDCLEVVQKLEEGYFDPKGKRFSMNWSMSNSSFVSNVVFYYNDHCE